MTGGVRVVAAPCNLGLRPLRPGHEPGTWRAPGVLLEAGLAEAVGACGVVQLPRPVYSPEAEAGTGLRHGSALRAFNAMLAETVQGVVGAGALALVVGGDCSILLGALAGARRFGPLFLVHVDGHSDFRHPGNHEAGAGSGWVAGMDLALATGRGEASGAQWPGVEGPLVLDGDVVQIGEREGRDEDFAWPDVNDTAMTRIDVFEAERLGVRGVNGVVSDLLGRKPGQGFWVHLDVDVLDAGVMPAVDSPGSPGLTPDELVGIVAPLVARRGCVGMSLTIYDPDLDPDGGCAAAIVAILARLPFRGREAVSRG